MRFVALVFAGLLIGTLPALAQDAGELAFWDSVKDSKNPSELQAYLDAYPEGKFGPLARIRIGGLSSGPTATSNSTPATPAPSTPALAPVAVRPIAPPAPVAAAPVPATPPAPPAAALPRPAAAPTVAAVPTPPSADGEESTLGTAALRFPADAPSAVDTRYVDPMLKAIQKDTKLACQNAESYRWDVSDWDKARLTRHFVAIFGELAAQGLTVTTLQSGLQGVSLTRVDDAQSKGSRRFLLLSAFEYSSQLYMVACMTS